MDIFITETNKFADTPSSQGSAVQSHVDLWKEVNADKKKTFLS